VKMLAIAFFATCVFLPSALSQGDDCSTLESCQAMLKANQKSSLALFRIGEMYFEQQNGYAAANMFREARNGDLSPKWVKLCARINLGKICDAHNQRNRAVNEYTHAIGTTDNTRGAQEEAAKYIKTPFRRP